MLFSYSTGELCLCWSHKARWDTVGSLANCLDTAVRSMIVNNSSFAWMWFPKCTKQSATSKIFPSICIHLSLCIFWSFFYLKCIVFVHCLYTGLCFHYYFFLSFLSAVVCLEMFHVCWLAEQKKGNRFVGLSAANTNTQNPPKKTPFRVLNVIWELPQFLMTLGNFHLSTMLLCCVYNLRLCLHNVKK